MSSEMCIRDRCLALPRDNKVPKHSAKRRRAAACGIACECGAVRTESFRKNLRPPKFSVRDHLRLRRNPCRLTMPGLAASQSGPQTLCQASACHGVWDCMRNQRGPDRKFSKKFRGRKIFGPRSHGFWRDLKRPPGRTENFAEKRKNNHNPKRTENSAWRAKCRKSTK